MPAPTAAVRWMPELDVSPVPAGEAPNWSTRPSTTPTTMSNEQAVDASSISSARVVLDVRHRPDEQGAPTPRG